MLPAKDGKYIERFYPGQQQEDLYWGFTQFSRQVYADTVTIRSEDEIMYGIFSMDGGTLAEIGMRWYRLGRECVPRMECFSEAFFLLKSPMHQRIFKRLQNEPDNFTPEEFASLLIEMGFQDDSDRPLER